MQSHEEFGKLRSIVFPIHKNELRKFLPMAFIFLLLTFNYAIVRGLKDMNLLTNTHAIVIYFTKVFGVTPSLIIFTYIYNRVSVFVGRDGRFNIMMTYFFITFILFATYLLPNLESLRLDSLAINLNKRFPTLSGLWEMVRYWHLSLFYIHAELFGIFPLGILFWTFANEITTMRQAKRFYSFLTIGASLGSLLAGIVLKLSGSNFNRGLYCGIITIMIVIVAYNSMIVDVIQNPQHYQIVSRKKKQVKMTLLESIKFICKSKYLTLITLMLLSYGLVISLFEAVYKAQIQEFAAIQGKHVLADIFGMQDITIGISCIIITVFFATKAFNKGWRFAASITPITILIMTTLFFAFLQCGDALKLFILFSSTPVPLTIIVGILIEIFIKSAKYVLFDTTKEAAFIPLDEESKVRGKAAVDALGYRLGKSLGSFIVTAFASLFGGGEIVNVKIYIVAIIFIVIFEWLMVVKKLGILKQEAEERYIIELAAGDEESK